MLTRPPGPALRPFVKALWTTDEWPAPVGRSSVPAAPRERVLPTGGVSLVFRLSEHPLRIFEEPSGAARTIGHAIVGGPRSAFYVRDVSRPAASVGAQLLPGAASLLLGVAAAELAERHTPLEDLWGAEAGEWRARLAEARSAERRLELFEALLLSRHLTRFRCVRRVHPAIARALEQFRASAPVAEAARGSGYSHRHFIALFRETVGLGPKQFCRVLRFQRVLERARLAPDAPWAALAFDAGYSDQSHFSREFHAFSGITPGRYRTIGPAAPNHVPER